MIQWTSDKRRLADLIPWDNNPRQLKEMQAEHLEISLDKFGLAIPFLISPNNEIYDGHQRQALMQMMTQYGPGAAVDVRVSDRLLTMQERKELVIRLHENTGEWDFDVLANVYDADELAEWGFPDWKLEGLTDMNDAAPIENDPPYQQPDRLPKDHWELDELGVPLLDLGLQADNFHYPILVWGAQARNERAGVFLFYTEDYRYSRLWAEPDNLVAVAPVALVEPNYSIYTDYPYPLALYEIYRKRWLARYWQDHSIRIFVDLNVGRNYADLNLAGVPKGWGAYATRGYSDRLNDLEDEINLAQQHAGDRYLNFIVYGGGAVVKDYCLERGLVWISEDRDRAKGKYVEYVG